MSELTARTPYLGKYALILLGGMAALMVVNAVLLATLGVPVPSGAAAIIPPMIAALVVGQTWGRETGAAPGNKVAWRFAVVAALIFLGLQIPITMFGLAAAGPLGAAPLGLVTGLLLATTAIVVLANRWFVTVGAKSVLKQR